MRKFKDTLLAQKIQVAEHYSLIKLLKGTIKLKLFNLVNRFDQLFIPLSFHMVVHRLLKPVHRDVHKERFNGYHTHLKNSTNKVPKKS